MWRFHWVVPHFWGATPDHARVTFLNICLKNLTFFLIWIIISNNFMAAGAFTMCKCSNTAQSSGTTLYYHQSLCSSMPLIHSNSSFYSQKPLPLKEQLTNYGCSHQNNTSNLSRKYMKCSVIFLKSKWHNLSPMIQFELSQKIKILEMLCILPWT